MVMIISFSRDNGKEKIMMSYRERVSGSESDQSLCFSVNFVKFRRTPFLQNTSGRLLLQKKKGKERYAVVGSKHLSQKIKDPDVLLFYYKTKEGKYIVYHVSAFISA